MNLSGNLYSCNKIIQSFRYINGTRLDDRIIRCDWDAGFIEGRQYGRGKTGGQVSWQCTNKESLVIINECFHLVSFFSIAAFTHIWPHSKFPWYTFTMVLVWLICTADRLSVGQLASTVLYFDGVNRILMELSLRTPIKISLAELCVGNKWKDNTGLCCDGYDKSRF